MSDYNPNAAHAPTIAADMSVDVGLRRFMLGVYNKLALGLVLSAGLAFVTGNVPAVQQMLFVTSDGFIRG